ncbi:uncharacterized protein LOC125616822 [Marmota marmota marmota]|uniref:uncharacterized protein LOC125616822 n=1 Tax=Marmota marmota marmota TaxID=9994 RepID=UPI0020935E63|nr:uncharacterized protein LOC125616822 [Marmota marmota marmota]
MSPAPPKAPMWRGLGSSACRSLARGRAAASPVSGAFSWNGCLKLAGINCPWCPTQFPCQEADSFSRAGYKKDFVRTLNQSLRDVAFEAESGGGQAGVWRGSPGPMIPPLEKTREPCLPRTKGVAQPESRTQPGPSRHSSPLTKRPGKVSTKAEERKVRGRGHARAPMCDFLLGRRPQGVFNLPLPPRSFKIIGVSPSLLERLLCSGQELVKCRGEGDAALAGRAAGFLEEGSHLAAEGRAWCCPAAALTLTLWSKTGRRRPPKLVRMQSFSSGPGPILATEIPDNADSSGGVRRSAETRQAGGPS